MEWYDGQAEYDAAYNSAFLAGVDMDKWVAINTEIARDSRGMPIMVNGVVKRIPNRFIYSYPMPNERARAEKVRKKKGGTEAWVSKYVDEEKTQALQDIRGYMTTEETDYYFEEFERRRKQGTDEDGRTFEEWYNDNHVYDPFSKSIIPIRCWTTSHINDNIPGTYEPSYSQSTKSPIDHFKNPQFDESSDISRRIKGEKYKNPQAKVLNEHEKGLIDYVRNTLLALAHTNSSIEYFKSGHLPTRHKEEEKDRKYYMRELGKLAGWMEGPTGREIFDENVNYENDWIPNMPMAKELMSKETIELIKNKPRLSQFRPDTRGLDPITGLPQNYIDALNVWSEKMSEAKAKDSKYHRENLDRNWEDVITDFMERAAHYNAVQDNKYQLYYAQSILKNQMMLDSNLGDNELTVDRRASTNIKTEYNTRSAKREYDQFTNWMRRLIFDQWKIPNRNWTKTAGILQSVTSANFMMANIRGGIANVTLGEMNIFSEAWAKDYFDWGDYVKGKRIWLNGVVSYFTHMYDDKSDTLSGAFIKDMNVVDFDEINGVQTQDFAAKTLQRARDWMFSPQSMGEHFMQNAAMFSLAVSTKLVENSDPVNNSKTSWVLAGRAEFIRDAHEKALMSILSDEQKVQYKNFRDGLLKDKNLAKEVVWFREDVTTQFAYQFLDNDTKNAFWKAKKEAEKEAIRKYEEAPSLWDQLTLGEDGHVAFKNGSILQQIDSNETVDGVSEANRILGAFKGRVISVNKKIHGVYDKLGSAQLEKYWWGSLAMQYHKHIYPGIMKRWRRHGYYNEERGSIEKGSYIALFDFISTPIKNTRRAQHMSDTEVKTMESIRQMFGNIVDFTLHIKTNYRILPEHEKANIRRNLGDIAGVVSAIAFAILLHGIGDDDDESMLYNLALYECDRLASESIQFNPIGAAAEAKKLWSNPFAVQSIANDALSAMGVIAQLLIEGDEFDPYYHSGKYAGEHKLKVYITRRIPIWRGIESLTSIGHDNHYYRLGKSMLGAPVDTWGNWVGKNIFGNGGK